jgi:AcrR family transcriptional regulator
VKARDLATRERLLEVAARLFAERGYHHVTVRDISREARANLAAVNYHFGDKLKLYLDVVQAALADVQPVEESLRAATVGQPAAERLEHYIRSMMSYAAAFPPERSRIQRLFGHEFNQPTEASALIMSRLFRPRLRFLSELVAELLGAPLDDERVRYCTSSIMGQFFLMRPNPLRNLLFDGPLSPATADALARHVLAFSLAGIRAFGTPSRRASR